MSTLKADTIVASDGSSPVTLTKQEAPKLIVRYTNVTTTASVGSPLNVSSLTDNGEGDTTISATSAFNDAYYGALATGTINSSSSGTSTYGVRGSGSWTNSSNSLTTSSARMIQRFISPTTVDTTDVDVITIALIGDLA